MMMIIFPFVRYNEKIVFQIMLLIFAVAVIVTVVVAFAVVVAAAVVFQAQCNVCATFCIFS